MVNSVQSNPATTSTSKTPTSKNKLQLQTQDFIKMMITQLQQQDPTKPDDSSQLLSQMSQISQMQSSSDLTTTLKSVAQQSQVGSAAGLIGKAVTGMDDDNNTINGQVTSVSVTDDGANLNLDSGKILKMTRLTAIAPPTPPATGTTTHA